MALSTIISLAVLGACGGGGTGFTPPGPVFAPIGPIAPAAFNGKEFPLFFAGLDGGGGSIQGVRAVGAADVISEEEVTITIAGQTFVR